MSFWQFYCLLLTCSIMIFIFAVVFIDVNVLLFLFFLVFLLFFFISIYSNYIFFKVVLIFIICQCLFITSSIFDNEKLHDMEKREIPAQIGLEVQKWSSIKNVNSAHLVVDGRFWSLCNTFPKTIFMTLVQIFCIFWFSKIFFFILIAWL